MADMAESPGDGTTRGKCPTDPNGLLCHSDGRCNVCQLKDGKNVGCQDFSSSPVCDADSSTTGVQQDSVNNRLESRGECVACKKDGKLALLYFVAYASILIAKLRKLFALL